MNLLIKANILISFSIISAYGVMSDDFEIQRDYIWHLKSKFTYKKIAENFSEKVSLSTLWKFANNKNNNGECYKTSPKILKTFESTFMHVRRHKNIFTDENAVLYFEFLFNSSEEKQKTFRTLDVKKIEEFHKILFIENKDIGKIRKKGSGTHQVKFSDMESIFKNTREKLKGMNVPKNTTEKPKKDEEMYHIYNFLAVLSVLVVDGQPLEDGNHRFSYFLCQKILSRFNLVLDISYKKFEKFFPSPEEENDDPSDNNRIKKFAQYIKKKIIHANTKPKSKLPSEINKTIFNKR